MRPLAGPAMMLVLVGGYLIFRLTSDEDAPSRDFTALEFAGADADHTGSCYSLDTVLIANRIGSTAVRTWTSTHEDAWTLLVDDIIQGTGGPVRDFQKFTFEKHSVQIRLTSVDASKGHPTDVGKNIDWLIDGPRARSSTPIDRCLEPGAAGYRFTPRR
ncbi:MAG TPA: hypothetical protein VFS58_13010 [Steroidobacteraceae bacterium]|nr:hypothetical protein [Steroidobacteraceae bacterium]